MCVFMDSVFFPQAHCREQTIVSLLCSLAVWYGISYEYGSLLWPLTGLHFSLVNDYCIIIQLIVISLYDYSKHMRPMRRRLFNYSGFVPSVLLLQAP